MAAKRLSFSKGPSIYDVHTEGGGGQAQVDACGRGGGGPAPCVRPHSKLKLESTDVILSSSHAKKFACRPHVDVHKGRRGVRPLWTHVDRGRGVKNPMFLWMS